MPELQIIGAPQSNYVWVSRIACLRRACRTRSCRSCRIRRRSRGAVHPLGKIPALRHGDVTLAKSRAICFYIDHAFDGPTLVSRDPVEGARTEQWISIVNTHFDVLVARPYVGAYFFPRARRTAAEPPDHRDRSAKAGSAIRDARPRRSQDRFPGRQQLHARRYKEVAADAVYLHHLPESGAMVRRNARPRGVL